MTPGDPFTTTPGISVPPATDVAELLAAGLNAPIQADAIKRLDLLSAKGSQPQSASSLTDSPLTDSPLGNGVIIVITNIDPRHPNAPYLTELFELAPIHFFDRLRNTHLLSWTMSGLLTSFAQAASTSTCVIGPSRSTDSTTVLELLAGLLPDDSPASLTTSHRHDLLTAARRLANRPV